MECGERVKDPALFVDVTGRTGKATSKDKLITEMFEAWGRLILSVCRGIIT